MSCQEGYNGYVWLCFDCPAEAARFLNVVSEYESGADSFYRRMIGRAPGDLQNWRFEVFVEDFDDAEDGGGAPPELPLELHVSIRFPLADLPRVLARFEAHGR